MSAYSFNDGIHHQSSHPIIAMALLMVSCLKKSNALMMASFKDSTELLRLRHLLQLRKCSKLHNPFKNETRNFKMKKDAGRGARIILGHPVIFGYFIKSSF